MRSPFRLDSELLDLLFVEYLNGHILHEEDPELSKELLREIVETAFRASQLREEGRFHSFILSFSHQTNKEVVGFSRPYLFPQPAVFSSEKIAKLATALDTTGEKINIWFTSDEKGVNIWGFGASEPEMFSLTAFDSGQLIIQFHLGRALILNSSNVAFINEQQNPFARYFESNPIDQNSNFQKLYIKDFQRLALMMRDHKHGGTLLIVPNSDKWRKSIDDYSFSTIRDFADIRTFLVQSGDQRGFGSYGVIQLINPEEELLIAGKSLTLIARMTALDGATVVTRDNFSVNVFGSKIVVPKSEKQKVKFALVTHPFMESKEIQPIAELGGTRHRSAAQFVYDQKDAIAIVASQDGKVSVMFWDKKAKSVSVTTHAEYLCSI